MVVSDTNFTSISLLPFLYNHREPNSLALFLALDLDINNNKPISFVCVCVCVCVLCGLAHEDHRVGQPKCGVTPQSPPAQRVAGLAGGPTTVTTSLGPC